MAALLAVWALAGLWACGGGAVIPAGDASLAGDASPADAGDAGDASLPDAGDASVADGGDAGPRPCVDSQECPDPAQPVCIDGTCQICNDSQQCASKDSAQPYCAGDGACVACLESAAHCTEDASPICAGGQCQPCTAGGGECATDYSGSRPHCASGRCVACTDSAQHCAGLHPYCDPVSGTCQPCSSHDECAHVLGVCAPDGHCLGESEAVFVDKITCPAVGDGSASAPYCSLQDGVDAASADSARDTVLVADGTYDDIQLTDVGALWILGTHSAAVITASQNGTTNVLVSGDSQVVLENLTIQSAGSSGWGIECTATAQQPELTVLGCTVTDNAGGGISASSSTVTISQSEVSSNSDMGILAYLSTVTISQSEVSSNSDMGISASSSTVTLDQNHVTLNTGGGVYPSDSDFTITNNVISLNGAASSGYGGVLIALPGTTALFAHNTVADNFAPGSTVAGIRCIDPVTIANTISHGNANGDLSAGCVPQTVFQTSDGDPGFVGSGDYHLSGTSPCIDQGDPSVAVDHDLDGEVRPRGAAPDIGADEYYP